MMKQNLQTMVFGLTVRLREHTVIVCKLVIMDRSYGEVKLGIGDYAAFMAMLAMSVAIGIYYAWKDKNATNADEYLVGGRSMSPIPVAFSLCVSYVSGILMVGLPAQVYYYGVISFSAFFFVTCVGPIIAAIYYIPVFFRLRITSVYEILRIRFGKVSRICGSTSIVVLMMVYMGLVTYIPCLALSAVSSVSLTTSIIITCGFCTFYTTLGGLKAVIWTDVIQALTMLTGMLLVIIKSTIAVGGSGEVVEALKRGGRWNLFVWDLDPRIRNTTWTSLFGHVTVKIMMTTINQTMVQRYLSCKNVKQARVAVAMLVVPQTAFVCLAGATGAVMYAYFENCDPLTLGKIEKKDQALPYMVAELFQNLPGLSGIFIAAVYSGTLSTISSGINALSAVVLHDYILPVKPHLEKYSLKISKVLVFVFGMLVFISTYIVKILGSLVIEAFFSAFGCIGGPLLGVYTMALMLPWVNEKGAVVGQIVGTAIGFWLSLGQILHPPGPKYLRMMPVSTSACSNATVEYMMLNSTQDFAPTMSVSEPVEYNIYSISNYWFGSISFATCILTGLLVSKITGFNDPEKANPLVFVPLMDNKRLPENVRKFFRFGVPEINGKVPLNGTETELLDKTYIE